MMGCTRILDASEQIVARDLYWEAICSDGKMELEKVEELLLGCVEKNPFVGEAHIVLGQVYLGMKRLEAAEAAADRGLRLIVEWGSPWDKRISWQGWITWGRVLLMKAWPDNPWAILNLGLVKEHNCWEWKRIQRARREENSDEGKKPDCIFLRLE